MSRPFAGATLLCLITVAAVHAACLPGHISSLSEPLDCASPKALLSTAGAPAQTQGGLQTVDDGCWSIKDDGRRRACSEKKMRVADGDKALEVTVDRIYQDSIFTHVYARVFNPSSSFVSRAEIICDVFDSNGLALGSSSGRVKKNAPGATVVGDVLVNVPDRPEPKSAECRVDTQD